MYRNAISQALTRKRRVFISSLLVLEAPVCGQTLVGGHKPLLELVLCCRSHHGFLSVACRAMPLVAGGETASGGFGSHSFA
jgi:hypothetical protein